jgi:glycosyltransferase involved in cell wall biosynthesis
MKNTPLSSPFPVHFTPFLKEEKKLPEVLFLTTFPPRECGIATYSQDLIFALNNKYKASFSLKIVALEIGNDPHQYTDAIDSILITDDQHSYVNLAQKSNQNKGLELVLIQHEFGLFRNNESDFISLLSNIKKPKIIVFHTVLPNPTEGLSTQIKAIDSVVDAIVVMTHAAAKILVDVYGIAVDKIAIIPHGTHLVEHVDKELLKEKYGFKNRKIVSTFGLLSSGKSIETTLDALPTIIEKNSAVLFLIIGKTHPSVVKNEGEKYRQFLQEKVEKLHLQNHVLFINQYVSLAVLLEYLQLTDIYLFTSKDRNQAVSGTFSYAISCGCPIISTPIPHASEVLQDKTGIIIDFENPTQLSKEVNRLLGNDALRKKISMNGLHKMMPNAWENAAISHASLFKKIAVKPIDLHFKYPKINLNHLKKMTTDFGLIQFSIVNQPDIKSGYTLDDNARAMVAMCQHYELYKYESDLVYIEKYLHFIAFCLQQNGRFLNYVDVDQQFTSQHNENLDDSNGRAIWALGYLLSLSPMLPQDLIDKADSIISKAVTNVLNIHSTRAMAFIIKGIYLSNLSENSFAKVSLIKHFANKMVQMYQHESDEKWKWFESYLTYANSILPEALLCAYLATGELVYKNIAQTSFQFLLSKTYKKNSIKVISNKGWLHNKTVSVEKIGGEQPIDIAYTIIALSKFYQAFGEDDYLHKMKGAFNWFMGDNHLGQIMYNPCTGGCFDGLEEDYINLNQGAESTVSYLMARLTLQKTLDTIDKVTEYKKRPLNRKTQKELYT